MSGGLVRVTYTGGSTVFGFDTIQKAPGVAGPNAWIKVGNLVYYAGPTGFYVTDGASVTPIGRGMVDDYFLSQWDENQPNVISAGVHWSKRLVYWVLPRQGHAGVPDEVMVYNIDEKNWTHFRDSVQLFVRGEEAFFSSNGVEAFDTVNFKAGVFIGTPGTATFITPEMEFNPGGKAMVNGVTPEIQGDNNFMTVAVTVGSRDNQGAPVTNTAATALTPFTGAADFVVDARFHRAQVDITGPFGNAIGGVFDAIPTSGV
jgi:hypothetical protein